MADERETLVERLKRLAENLGTGYYASQNWQREIAETLLAAAAALERPLAQPVAQPDLYVSTHDWRLWTHINAPTTTLRVYRDKDALHDLTPLFSSPLAQGMVGVPIDIFQAALNYIRHCGANQIMRGEPHPQQMIVDGLELAAANQPAAVPAPEKGGEKERGLEEIVRAFIRDQRINAPETIYQCDWVIENAYEFIEKLCDAVGYAAPADDGRGE